MRWTTCTRHDMRTYKPYLRNCCSPVDQSISLLDARALAVRHRAPLTALVLLTRARTTMSIHVRERHSSNHHHRHDHTHECLSAQPQMACRDNPAPARMSMHRTRAQSGSMRAHLIHRCHTITHLATRVVPNLHHFITLHSLAVIALLACRHGGSCEARAQRARSIEHSMNADEQSATTASRSLTRSFDRLMNQLNTFTRFGRSTFARFGINRKGFRHIWDTSHTATL